MQRTRADPEIFLEGVGGSTYSFVCGVRDVHFYINLIGRNWILQSLGGGVH